MYWQVIGTTPENLGTYVKAIAVMHNYIRRNTRTGWEPVAISEMEVSVLQDMRRMGSNNAAKKAMHVREIYASYLSVEGAVPWHPRA